LGVIVFILDVRVYSVVNTSIIKRMSRLIFFILLLFATSAAISGDFAEKGYGDDNGENRSSRVALVIGNSSYPEAPLSNPANDASDLAFALEKKGFDVLVREDVGENGLKEAVELFSKHLKKGGVGLFFFAGHGTQLINGENQLIPVDATFDKPEDILSKSVSAEHVLDLMSNAGNRVNIVILDACRNNPFDNKVSPSNHGLVAMTVRSPGTFISYATAPGSTASDGSAHNGLFTQHLLKSLDEPGSDIEKVFGRVRKGVYKDSNGGQLPSTFSSLIDSFFFDPVEDGGKPAVQTARTSSGDQECPFANQLFDSAEEQQSWEKTRDSQNLSDYTEYLTRFGGSKNSGFACFRWKRLGGKVEKVEPVEAPRQEQELSGAAAVESSSTSNESTVPASSNVPFASNTEAGQQSGSSNVPVTLGNSIAAMTSNNIDVATATHKTENNAESHGGISTASSGALIVDCPQCPQLVVLPQGEFMMGRNSGDPGGEADEVPQHLVRISQASAVGVYEVTRGQFTAFIKESGYHIQSKGCNTKRGGWFHKEAKSNWESPGFEQNETHPVVCVSWLDAQSYVQWLSKSTGKHYRLLSEAEWEYVAKSPVISFINSKGEAPCKLFNIADSSTLHEIPGVQHLACSDGYSTTASVGSFPANSFGLFDVLGNAWEWVEDCWNDNYVGAPDDGGSWTQGSCDERVFRGGGWNTPPKVLNYSYRDHGDKAESYDDVGFRVLRSLP